MAEVAGLVLGGVGVLGIAGLFKSCIENFDIVVRAKDFGEDFDLLCTQLSLQRIRLVLWGESLGLVPNPDRRSIPYNCGLNRPDIRPAVESSLNHLRLLLEKADLVADRFELKDGDGGNGGPHPQSATDSPSKGLVIFRERFEAFRTRIRTNQRQKSTWTVTRWSVHDSVKFSAIITKIKDLMDSLESITSTLGMLQRQQASLVEEIASISDMQSLRLVERASLSSGSRSESQKLIADTASSRLRLVGESGRSVAIRSISEAASSSQSFHTAPSHPRFAPTTIDVAEAGEDDANNHARPADPYSKMPSQQHQGVQASVTPRASGTKLRGFLNPEPASTPSPADMPQNQRLMADLLKKRGGALPKPSFSSGEECYGRAIAAVKSEDDKQWEQVSLNLILKAHEGVSTARRVFLELRSIRNANVSFMSASPVGDRLDMILASIEGPPDTPYEGGIFWITVKIPTDPSASPVLRFRTRIFHPNVDFTGKICADYSSWWSDPDLRRYFSSLTGRKRWVSDSSWFSGPNSTRYSLGALLTALCALLASPNVDDPLVPEIAGLYITDYSRFGETAREYTRKYANGSRPGREEMLDNGPDNDSLEEIQTSTGPGPGLSLGPSVLGIGSSSIRASTSISASVKTLVDREASYYDETWPREVTDPSILLGTGTNDMFLRNTRPAASMNAAQPRSLIPIYTLSPEWIGCLVRGQGQTLSVRVGMIMSSRPRLLDPRFFVRFHTGNWVDVNTGRTASPLGALIVLQELLLRSVALLPLPSTSALQLIGYGDIRQGHNTFLGLGQVLISDAISGSLSTNVILERAADTPIISLRLDIQNPLGMLATL